MGARRGERRDPQELILGNQEKQEWNQESLEVRIAQARWVALSLPNFLLKYVFSRPASLLHSPRGRRPL